MLTNQQQNIIYASHSQFYIEDAENYGDTGDEHFWTTEAADRQLAVMDGTIGVGTDTYGNVLVKMEFHDSPPEFNATTCDYAIETTLEITSGRLRIVGCLDDDNATVFNARNSHYNIRCCYADLDKAEQVKGELDGGDCYLVQFRLANHEQKNFSVKVLKSLD